MSEKFDCGCLVDVDGDGDAPIFEQLCDRHGEMEVTMRQDLYDKIVKFNAQ